MITKLRRRVSSAHVIALAALFVALGGTAFAAATVGTSEIKDGAVTKQKLRNLAVARQKIANGAVVPAKIRDNAVKTDKIADQAVSPDKVADMAVGTDKLADSAVNSDKIADGSLRIADLAIWTKAGNIGGTTTDASACHYFNFGTPTGALASDLVLVQSDVGVPAGLELSAVLRPDGGVTGGTCNFTTSPIALPNPFVLRIHGLR